mgnify:FL=1
MKTLGFMKVALLPLTISGIIMGSSIASPTPTLRGPTSEENTSCKKENQGERNEESQASQIGSSTTEVLKSLNRILEVMAEILSEEKSYHSTERLEK